MNIMEKGLLKYLNKKQLSEIGKSKIGIAGCGGLGSNLAHNLVRLGYRDFILVDHDDIENTNLNRQFFFINQIGKDKSSTLKENLLKINPDINVTTHKLNLTSENIKSIFNECNIVTECFDNTRSKQIFLENILDNKKYVAASGLGNLWNVEEIKIHKVKENLCIIGDLKSDTEDGISPLSPGVSIAAAKQAAVILEYTLGGIDDQNS